jgi:hypothetical protein
MIQCIHFRIWVHVDCANFRYVSKRCVTRSNLGNALVEFTNTLLKLGAFDIFTNVLLNYADINRHEFHSPYCVPDIILYMLTTVLPCCSRYYRSYRQLNKGVQCMQLYPTLIYRNVFT